MTITGGSKSDATVTLAYEAGVFRRPMPDKAEALRLATERCKAWGYESAQPFGGTVKECNYEDEGTCYRYLHKTEYQCIGDLD